MRKVVTVIMSALMLIIASAATADSVVIFGKSGEGFPPLGVSGQLEVHFINIGPVDCILLRCDEQTMLVDSGLRGNHVNIADYLQSIGVNRLDYAFATHPHKDHIGGLARLLDTIPADIILWPPLFDDYEIFVKTELLASIKEKGIPLRIVENNAVMQLGGARLTFMQWQNPSASVNDRSMIMKAEYGDRSILLAADLENAGQAAMLAEYGDRLRADILKMPHHGLTSYTREVNETVAPSLGVSANGKGISATLSDYRKYSVEYMITAQGAVIAVTDGAAWAVRQKIDK